jgi:hypothetical protein
MTIKLPKPNFADKFLRMIGKKRGVRLPKNMGSFGHQIQIVGIKESFWKALTRPKNGILPEGTVDIFLAENLKQ